jgi:hypothetical protein
MKQKYYLVSPLRKHLELVLLRVLMGSVYLEKLIKWLTL